MKKLFYYLYGIITVLFVCAITFNQYCDEIIDSYYLDQLYTTYANEWNCTNTVISTLMIFFTLTWVYSLGKNANESINNKSIIKNEENNE